MHIVHRDKSVVFILPAIQLKHFCFLIGCVIRQILVNHGFHAEYVPFKKVQDNNILQTGDLFLYGVRYSQYQFAVCLIKTSLSQGPSQCIC